MHPGTLLALAIVSLLGLTPVARAGEAPPTRPATVPDGAPVTGVVPEPGKPDGAPGTGVAPAPGAPDEAPVAGVAPPPRVDDGAPKADSEAPAPGGAARAPVAGPPPGGIAGALERLGERGAAGGAALGADAGRAPGAGVGAGGPLRLAASVGLRGANRPDDVRALQAALEARGFLAPGAYAPGVCGPETIAAIERFQREVAGFRAPDGRVDPDERTLRALNGEPEPDRAPGLAGLDAPLGAPAAEAPTAGAVHAPVGPRTPPRVGPRADASAVAPALGRGTGRPAARDLDEAAAFAELDALGVPYTRLRDALGVSDPVRLEFPLLGVDFRYVAHGASPPRTVDARLAVALAHLAPWLRERGVVRVLHVGMHVTHRAGGGGTTELVNDHARGLAIDVGGFVVRDAQGERVIDVARAWGTARSDTRRGEGGAGVVAQTPAELAAMSDDERFLREVWALLRAEFDVVVTPSHNREHWDHFHAGLRSTPRQRARSTSSFERTGHGE